MEIIEAARLDGAGPLQIVWTIVMPLMLPMVIFFVTLQRHIVSGLVSGGVKG